MQLLWLLLCLWQGQQQQSFMGPPSTHRQTQDITSSTGVLVTSSWVFFWSQPWLLQALQVILAGKECDSPTLSTYRPHSRRMGCYGYCYALDGPLLSPRPHVTPLIFSYSFSAVYSMDEGHILLLKNNIYRHLFLTFFYNWGWISQWEAKIVLKRSPVFFQNSWFAGLVPNSEEEYRELVDFFFILGMSSWA